MPVVVAQAEQPGSGLNERLEHEDTGHDRERRKVVRQILLAQGQRLDHSYLATGVKPKEPIHQLIAHLSISVPNYASANHFERWHKKGSIAAPPPTGNPECAFVVSTIVKVASSIPVIPCGKRDARARFETFHVSIISPAVKVSQWGINAKARQTAEWG